MSKHAVLIVQILSRAMQRPRQASAVLLDDFSRSHRGFLAGRRGGQPCSPQRAGGERSHLGGGPHLCGVAPRFGGANQSGAPGPIHPRRLRTHARAPRSVSCNTPVGTARHHAARRAERQCARAAGPTSPAAPLRCQRKRRSSRSPRPPRRTHLSQRWRHPQQPPPLSLQPRAAR